MRLETAGRPTVVIATERFVDLARRAAQGQGLPEARVATVPHPIGGTSQEQLELWARRATDQLVELLGGG